MFLQRTIRKRVKVEGIGLHTGQPSSVHFIPAPPETGIVFQRADLPGKPVLRVESELVTATALATTLGNQNFSVATVEHCLSSLAAYRIDNLIIELEGPEIPICDGSAKVFSDALLSVGFADQDVPRSYIYVKQPIFLGDQDKHAQVVPYNGLRITCTIEFPHPMIGRQTKDIDINDTTFARELSAARTFGFAKEVELLRSRGLILGGSLDNAIVLTDTGMMNTQPLRWADEFVRHKILDALGDLVTLGRPIMGHLILYRAGHDLVQRLVKRIKASSDAYQQIEIGLPAAVEES